MQFSVISNLMVVFFVFTAYRWQSLLLETGVLGGWKEEKISYPKPRKKLDGQGTFSIYLVGTFNYNIRSDTRV